MDPPALELRCGDVVDGRYRIGRRLGRGGMGTVYEAQQIKLERHVALKVLRPEFASKDLAARRFAREAKAASSIDHRNVVKILDFGNLESGELYYTMELLQGRDLSQVLRDHGRMPWSRAGWILLQVVRAFAAIHDKGIVHRDIKPANCFLLDMKAGDEPDLVKILDFGIVNLQEQSKATALTAASDIIGSVHYMAPEQAASDEVDARTDVYSLGIMMYELLTGQVPFGESNVFKVMRQHQTESARPPRELVPEIPPEVEAIILRAIAKRPEDRFQSMVEVETELLPLVEAGQGSGVLPRTSPSGIRSQARSGVDRLSYATGPGPTGTLALPSMAMGPVPGVTGTIALSPGAPEDAPPMDATVALTSTAHGQASAVAAPDTALQVGGSVAFTAGTYAAPRRRAARLPIVMMVLLVSCGALALTPWLLPEPPTDAVVAGIGHGVAEPDEPRPTPAQPESAEPDGGPPLALAPPPEQAYDPFADPFGAPPLRRRVATGSVMNDGEGLEAAAVEVLAQSLPPESWTLEPGTIAGRILDENGGRALSTARVCAWIADPAAPLELRRRPRCSKVDRRGRFEIREIAPSLYDISAFARGYAPQSLVSRDGQPLAVPPGERTDGVEIALVAGGAELRGTVKTAVGTPIAAASVSVVGSARALAQTNAAGELSLWVGEGEVAVVAWAEGYGDVVARGRAGEPLKLVLPLQGVLVGRVVDRDSGEPIANARVRAGSKSGGIDPLVHTDASGRFRITALPEGSYQPSASTDDARGRAEHEVRILEGTVSAEVTIEIVALVVAPAPAPEPVPEPVRAIDPSTDAMASDAGETDAREHTGAARERKDDERRRRNEATRRKATARLEDCLSKRDTDGSIVIARTAIDDTGKLREVDVRVTGTAKQHPEVERCAIAIAEGLTLIPGDRDFVVFKRLEVKLEAK